MLPAYYFPVLFHFSEVIREQKIVTRIGTARRAKLVMRHAMAGKQIVELALIASVHAPPLSDDVRTRRPHDIVARIQLFRSRLGHAV